MPLLRSNTADKIIVDRRKPHRNSDVARAVRKTRDRLSQQPGNPVFDRELLKLHARAMVNSAAAIPLLVLLIARRRPVCRHGHRDPDLGADHRRLLCRRWRWSRSAPTAPTPPTSTSPATRRNFLIAHFVSGLGWAYFALARLRRMPGRPVPGGQGGGAAAGHRRDGADRLVAARRAVVTFALPVAVYALLGARSGRRSRRSWSALLDRCRCRSSPTSPAT